MSPTLYLFIFFIIKLFLFIIKRNKNLKKIQNELDFRVVRKKMSNPYLIKPFFYHDKY